MKLYLNEAHDFHSSSCLIGIDEAGRGPLAGPVVAAAVILDKLNPISGIQDSKKLSEKKRENLFKMIIQNAYAIGISFVFQNNIDEINILQATLHAMETAYSRIDQKSDIILIDGNKAPKSLQDKATTVVKGDGRYASIAAASILAKVTRDKYMIKMDTIYPQYGFKKNKGYPTKDHLVAIDKFGICDLHRKSYKPIQQRSFRF